jgi:hypothetical protein
MKKGIIQEADEIINGARRDDYGGAEESFTKIWIGWDIINQSDIPGPEKVALCMDWLKTCRYLNGRQRDSLVDKIGYVGCIEQIRGDL